MSTLEEIYTQPGEEPDSLVFILPGTGYAEVIPDEEDESALHFEGINVNDSARKQGHAGMLATHVLEYARKEGYKRITAEVHNDIVARGIAKLFESERISAHVNDSFYGVGDKLTPEEAIEYLETARAEETDRPQIADALQAAVHFSIEL